MRRRPFGLVIAVLWLILAPICQAQCEPVSGAGTEQVPAVIAGVDCHGEPRADASGTTAECDWPHEPTHSGTDRVDLPAAMVATLRLPPMPVLRPAVRVAATQDPAFQGQGPPLRLLTLRFIE